ncbi:exosome complex component RRP43 [Nilaparvata lugens]|uniref:exosome complex component RRP43 n=1 Tax=Nilaparvata lugens TaxID=108931 RepID=UPI000B99A210|nr:exosome complex component RRP43 [Nilaparvata lugens]
MDNLQYRNIHPLKHFRECLAHNVRPDGRQLMKVRPATVNVGSIGTADGSAVVKVGRTSVVCGIKAELTAPKPSHPDVGFLVPNVDLPPLCSLAFRPGPPSDVAQSMTSMLNSIVASCGLVDLKQLCVSKEHLVWILHCDIVCLDYNGSVMDAVLIALVAALRTVELPHVSYCEETKSFSVDLKQRRPLSVASWPVSTTFATIDETNIIADPTVEEERLSNGSIIVVTDGTRLFSINKPGGTAYSETDLQKCISLAKDRAININKMLETALNNREQ